MTLCTFMLNNFFFTTSNDKPWTYMMRSISFFLNPSARVSKHCCIFNWLFNVKKKGIISTNIQWIKMIVDGICWQKSIRQKSIDKMSVVKMYYRRMIYNSKKRTCFFNRTNRILYKSNFTRIRYNQIERIWGTMNVNYRRIFLFKNCLTIINVICK